MGRRSEVFTSTDVVKTSHPTLASVASTLTEARSKVKLANKMALRGTANTVELKRDELSSRGRSSNF